MNYWVNAIGLSLVHFLWQGASVALVLAIAMRLFARQHANLRYAMSYGAILVCALCPLFTLLRLTWPQVALSSSVSHVPETYTFVSAISSDDVVMGTHSQTTPWLSYVVWVWALGVCVLSVRLLGGVWLVDVLRRKRSIPALAEHQLQLDSLARRIGLKRKVQLRDSESINSPSALGVFRVCVIVPVSLWTKFPANQIETLLLHELAHIRRHDYLLNLIQSAIEVVLFYNPAIWWISRVIRIEREHCCDEWVVKITGDSTAYARALCKLDLDRSAAPTLSMSARGGLLLQRIARILSQSKSPVRLASVWSVSVPAMAVTLGLVICVRAQSQPQVPSPHTVSTLSNLLGANLKNLLANPPAEPRQPKLIVPTQVSANFKNASFPRIIAILAARDKFTYKISGGVYRNATVNVQGKPLKQSIQMVCDAASASYTVSDGKYLFASKLATKYPRIVPANLLKTPNHVPPMQHADGLRALVNRSANSFKFEGASFQESIAKVASWAGISYTVKEGFYRKVTMNRSFSSASDAISALCSAADATWIKEGDVYTFSPTPLVSRKGANVLDCKYGQLSEALSTLAEIKEFSYSVQDHPLPNAGSCYRFVNVHLVVTDLESSLKAICDSAGATWRKEGNIYTIIPKE